MFNSFKIPVFLLGLETNYIIVFTFLFNIFCSGKIHEQVL